MNLLRNGMLIDPISCSAANRGRGIMKTLCIWILVLITGVCFSSRAIAQPPTEGIGNALASGNVGAIARHMDNTIMLTVPGSQASYSKSQAEMILVAFFQKHKPSSYETSQQKTTATGAFAIGQLKTSCGVFRTYFSLRGKEGAYKLQELRIEK